MDQQRLILRERAERTNMLDGQSLSRDAFCFCVPSCPIGGVRASGVSKPANLRQDVIPPHAIFASTHGLTNAAIRIVLSLIEVRDGARPADASLMTGRIESGRVKDREAGRW